jgi:hypothetical protein
MGLEWTRFTCGESLTPAGGARLTKVLVFDRKLESTTRQGGSRGAISQSNQPYGILRITGVNILFTATIVAEGTCAISGGLDRVFAPYGLRLCPDPAA